MHDKRGLCPLLFLNLFSNIHIFYEMKKLFFLLLIGLFAFLGKSNGQTVGYSGLSSDTLTNADTAYVNVASGSIVANGLTSIQAVLVRINGTLAGNVTLQGLNAASTWETVKIDSSFGGANPATLSNTATYVYTWPISLVAYSKYRLQVITSGTVNARYGVAWLYRSQR
jgi:hypothetical protein